MVVQQLYFEGLVNAVASTPASKDGFRNTLYEPHDPRLGSGGRDGGIVSSVIPHAVVMWAIAGYDNIGAMAT